MKIRIVKNAKDIGEKMLFNNSVLKVVKEDTNVLNVSICKFYLYNIEKNKEEEILREYKKYDLFEIIDIQESDEFIYFLAIDDITKETPMFGLYKYDLIKREAFLIYSFETKMEQYLSFMRTKVFIVNENFVLLQHEYLRANLSDNFEGYFDFELQLYSVHDGRIYKVVDENLSNNGISDIVCLEDNICAIKTGFSLLDEDRYNKLTKSEVSVEGISIVNILQIVSDMMIMKPSIVIDSIENAFYDATIPYIEKNGDYLIYSKVNFEKREEEIVFYNFKKKEVRKCINTNIYSTNDLGKHLVLNDYPYIMNNSSKGVEFYNIEKNKVDIKFAEDVVVEAIKNDFIIVSQNVKPFIGKAKKYIMVYKYPALSVAHKEKGVFKGCLAGSYDEIFVLLSDEKGE